jgi:acylphosphatase
MTPVVKRNWIKQTKWDIITIKPRPVVAVVQMPLCSSPACYQRDWQRTNVPFILKLSRFESVTKGEPQQREIYYSGTVQGVGFRYTVRALARGFAVSGYVRNLPDGEVQLVVEGAADQIDGLLASVREELGHYIRRADETIRPAGGNFLGFEIRF